MGVNIVAAMVGLAVIVGCCWLYRHPDRLMPQRFVRNRGEAFRAGKLFAALVLVVVTAALVDPLMAFLVPESMTPILTLPVTALIAYLLLRKP